MDFFQNFFLFSSWKTLFAFLVLGGVFFLLKLLKEKEYSFSQRMLVALVCGGFLGFAMQYFAHFPQGGIGAVKNNIELLWFYQSYAWFGFLASIFVSFLKLIVVPLVFVGMMYVILNLRGDVKLSSMFSLSLFWLLFTTAIASSIAVCLGTYFSLGDGFVFDGLKEAREVKSLDQILLGLMPSNLIDSMGKNAVIGVVIFAIIFALCARKVGQNNPHYRSFVGGIEFLHSVMMELAMLLINLMPYAVVVMVAKVLMQHGFEVFIPVLSFIALIYLCAFFVFCVHLLIVSFHGLSPVIYCKKAIPVLLMAFTSRSSIATLPVTIETLKKMGVSQMSSSFVATLATTIGANGCAGYFGGLVGVFAFQALGFEVGIMQGITIVLLSVVASIGVAGIPGIATMVASIMLTGLGMGEYFGILVIILAIDPIIDMARTMSNVSGGMVSSIAVDRELGMFDESLYKS